MKKAFTLVELLISITLFMVILTFLYKTLEQTKHSNKLFSQKEKKLEESNYLYKIFLEDITEAKNVPDKPDEDKNKNSRVKFESNNTYHNPFYTHITYLVGSNDKLVRIESKKPFSFTKPNSLDFYNNAYIDVLLEDIEYFIFKKNLFIIKQKNKEKMIFKTFEIRKDL